MLDKSQVVSSGLGVITLRALPESWQDQKCDKKRLFGMVKTDLLACAKLAG